MEADEATVVVEILEVEAGKSGIDPFMGFAGFGTQALVGAQPNTRSKIVSTRLR